MKFDLLLYAVTDRAWTGTKTLADQIEEALKAGVTMVQLREKELAADAFLEEAKLVKRITDAYGVPLIIDDHVAVALACDAAGVHIGQDDMDVVEVRRLLGPDKIIGVTAKTVAQAQLAEQQGADYLGVGAVFGSATKPDAKSITLEQLQAITAAVTIPAVAIGGISQDNILRLRGRGVAGVAVVSGIFAAGDISKAVSILKKRARLVVQERKKVLSIAGSDCSGGAGIQADLKTMLAMGTYGMSVITALTAQNTTGVAGIFNVAPEFVARQLDCVFTDIVPDAVKIGMVSQKEIIQVIAEKLRQYQAQNIVLDPVMVSTSKSRLMEADAMEVFVQELLPLATVLTPNIPEAEVLSGMTITSESDMEQAAGRIGEICRGAVLVKGGHLTGAANDVLYQNGQSTWFCGARIETVNTHGTGCTLSSAIACGLAEGKSIADSVRTAKFYLSEALLAGLNLGKGNGPLDHGVQMDALSVII